MSNSKGFVPFSSYKKRKMTKSKTKTTLQRNQDGPFPRSKNTTLVYENALTALGSGTGGLLTVGTKPNSAFDYDNSSGAVFGNKQPLYYDTLLTSSGPYKNYKVNSWKTTYTIVNNGDNAMTVWALPPISATAEIDSAAEADNFPGVKRMYLTPKGGSHSQGSITVTGNLSDVYASSAASEGGMIAAYNADPTYLVYSGLVIQTADAGAIVAYAAVRHEMKTTLQVVDALVS
jgi:hypothetical protein